MRDFVSCTHFSVSIFFITFLYHLKFCIVLYFHAAILSLFCSFCIDVVIIYTLLSQVEGNESSIGGSSATALTPKLAIARMLIKRIDQYNRIKISTEPGAELFVRHLYKFRIDKLVTKCGSLVSRRGFKPHVGRSPPVSVWSVSTSRYASVSRGAENGNCHNFSASYPRANAKHRRADQTEFSLRLWLKYNYWGCPEESREGHLLGGNLVTRFRSVISFPSVWSFRPTSPREELHIRVANGSAVRGSRDSVAEIRSIAIINRILSFGEIQYSLHLGPCEASFPRPDNYFFFFILIYVKKPFRLSVNYTSGKSVGFIYR